MAQMKEDLLALGEMVDKHGLKNVLSALADICFEKNPMPTQPGKTKDLLWDGPGRETVFPKPPNE